MLTVLTANSQAGGFTIANSLRFRASASAYLNRTPSVAGNRKTWTWSGWVKRGILSSSSAFGIIEGNAGVNDLTAFNFYNDTLRLQDYSVGGGYNLLWATSSVFRDPSAWYHIVIVYDTTQASSSNAIKIYVNGVQQSLNFTAATGSYVQNRNSYINSTNAQRIGVYNGLANYFDGYLTEVNFIDGQALTPSSFGETDALTGVWKPKAYSGTYGTNGFRLNFSNGTSTTTLGYDSSGNGNNWTTNNISLTAGSTYDWMIDSPTPYQGSSYGVGNYAVLNPLDVAGSLTISDANSKLTGGSSAWGLSRSGFGMTSGKWYWEVTILSANTAANGIVIGIANSVAQTAGYGTANNWSYNNNTGGTGRKNLNGVSSSYGITYVANDVVGVAFNADAGTLTFYVNNSSQGVAASSGLPNPAFPMTECYGTDSVAVNFGQRPFAYTPPSGYKSLCTQNLPGVTIQNGAAYMAATTYTGNGSTQSISNAVNGVSFQPDFVWTKTRSTVQNHAVYDVVRGTQQRLLPNLTNAEDTVPGVTSFNSSGFSVGANIASNESGSSFVAWQWKAGGTAVTNTAGSITSSVSANTTSGFSVVTYTATAANATVGHGLGVAPSMIITARRSTSGAYWGVYHASLGATQALYMQTTDSAQTNSAFWNNTAPTSSVFSLGTSAQGNNPNGGTYVAYCFAAIPGYSAFGSYTGNGSTDGPFVFTGMRPRWIMVKRTNVAEVWAALDTSRNPYNIVNEALFPNTSDATYTFNYIDILSNGFKVKNTGTGTNASGGTYIYAAFAENPFQNALAR